MKRVLFFVYGVFCHGLFLAVFAYMAAFVGGFLVPHTIDGAGGFFTTKALLINVGMLVVFGLQHSVMARPGFKRWFTQFVPKPIERSTYVLVSCVLMLGLMYFWQPMGPVLWDVPEGGLRTAGWVVFGLAWLSIPLTSFHIDHFDLFGTRQVWLHLRGKPYEFPAFGTPGIYNRVRHPLYLGWMMSFWIAPTMSVGHVLFASVCTVYMLIAIPFEERDLVAMLGDTYRGYRAKVPALFPRPGKSARERRDDGVAVPAAVLEESDPTRLDS